MSYLLLKIFWLEKVLYYRDLWHAVGRKGGHDPAWLWILLYNSHHQHILHGYFSSLSELWKVSIVWKYCAMEFTRWQPRKLKKDIFHLTDGRLCHISHKNSGCMWYSNITSGRKSKKKKTLSTSGFYWV